MMHTASAVEMDQTNEYSNVAGKAENPSYGHFLWGPQSTCFYMNDNIKKMLERQGCWQKTRKAESWIEKLAKSAAARKSLLSYPGHKLKQFTVADDSKSLPDKNPTTK